MANPDNTLRTVIKVYLTHEADHFRVNIGTQRTVLIFLSRDTVNNKRRLINTIIPELVRMNDRLSIDSVETSNEIPDAVTNILVDVCQRIDRHETAERILWTYSDDHVTTDGESLLNMRRWNVGTGGLQSINPSMVNQSMVNQTPSIPRSSASIPRSAIPRSNQSTAEDDVVILSGVFVPAPTPTVPNTHPNLLSNAPLGSSLGSSLQASPLYSAFQEFTRQAAEPSAPGAFDNAFNTLMSAVMRNNMHLLPSHNRQATEQKTNSVISSNPNQSEQKINQQGSFHFTHNIPEKFNENRRRAAPEVSLNDEAPANAVTDDTLINAALSNFDGLARGNVQPTADRVTPHTISPLTAQPAEQVVQPAISPLAHMPPVIRRQPVDLQTIKRLASTISSMIKQNKTRPPNFENKTKHGYSKTRNYIHNLTKVFLSYEEIDTFIDELNLLLQQNPTDDIAVPLD